MLTMEDVKEVLKRVKYEDWSFEVWESFTEADKYNIRVGFLAPDNYAIGFIAGRRVGFTLLLNYPEEEHLESVDSLLQWLMSRVEKIVLHEAQEKFKFAGDRVFDPHANGKKNLRVDFSRFSPKYHSELVKIDGDEDA